MHKKLQDVYDDKYADFIQQLYQKQPKFSKMAAIVLRTHKASNDSYRKLDEVVQLVRFCLNGYGVFLLKSANARRVFVIVQSQNIKALAIIETSIKKEFIDNDVSIELSVALDTGLQKFCEILAVSIPKNEKNALYELKRLGRGQKIFLIYSHGKDIKEKLEKTLKPFGRVIACHNREEFTESCSEYAPNAVFVDASLYKEQKEISVSQFRKHIDRYCKYLVVSKESDMHLVHFFLSEGVSGFLLHPVTAQALLNQFSRMRLLFLPN